MADAILQMFGNTLGVGTTNSVAFVDVPQSGKIRKIRMLPVFRGTVGIGFADAAFIFEVSTLPTARWNNNGDYGNVFARGSWCVEAALATQGGGMTQMDAQEITGLDYRISVGQRIYLHVYASVIPATQDDCLVDLYIDA